MASWSLRVVLHKCYASLHICLLLRYKVSKQSNVRTTYHLRGQASIPNAPQAPLGPTCLGATASRQAATCANERSPAAACIASGSLPSSPPLAPLATLTVFLRSSFVVLRICQARTCRSMTARFFADNNVSAHKPVCLDLRSST